MNQVSNFHFLSKFHLVVDLSFYEWMTPALGVLSTKWKLPSPHSSSCVWSSFFEHFDIHTLSHLERVSTDPSKDKKERCNPWFWTSRPVNHLIPSILPQNTFAWQPQVSSISLTNANSSSYRKGKMFYNIRPFGAKEPPNQPSITLWKEDGNTSDMLKRGNYFK